MDLSSTQQAVERESAGSIEESAVGHVIHLPALRLL